MCALVTGVHGCASDLADQTARSGFGIGGPRRVEAGSGQSGRRRPCGIAEFLDLEAVALDAAEEAGIDVEAVGQARWRLELDAACAQGLVQAVDVGRDEPKGHARLGRRLAIDADAEEGVRGGLVDMAEVVLVQRQPQAEPVAERSEEHTSELQSLMRISYAVFCLKKTNALYLSTVYSLFSQSLLFHLPLFLLIY